MDILDSRVLVLNKLYNPIRTATVRDAFSKIFANAAEVITVENGVYENHNFTSWAEVSEYKQLFEQEELGPEVEWINTPSLRLQVPRVIRMLGYEKSPKFRMRLTRKNIYIRDNHTCQYCGKVFTTEELNLDHVTPRSKGGKNLWTNLVCSCIKCNRKKKNHTLKEAGMRLLSKPHKPKPQYAFRISLTGQRYTVWEHFINDLYWNTTLKE